MPDIIDFRWALVADNLIRVAVAFVLALPIAWERGKGVQGIGFRTFPVVAMAACGYALIVKEMPEASPEARARLLQGILTGVGFIGGGAIVKNGGSVRGLITAASIWNTGAIGASVAYEREEIAIVLSFINLVTLLLLTPIVEEEADDPGGDHG